MSDHLPPDTPAEWLAAWPFVAPPAPAEVDDLVDVDRLVAGAIAEHPDLLDDLDTASAGEVVDLSAFRRRRRW